MDIIKEHNEKYSFFRAITGEAMRVHRIFKPGLLESAYEAALKYLLELKGYQVERQAFLPIYWDDVQLDQTYRMDLVINGNVIAELKAVQFVGIEHRKQLWNYMNLTHTRFGMVINFGANRLYSEWYERDPASGEISQVRLL